MEAQISTHLAPDRPRGPEWASVKVLESSKRNAAAIVSRKGAMFVSRVDYTRRLYCPTLPFCSNDALSVFRNPIDLDYTTPREEAHGDPEIL